LKECNGSAKRNNNTVIQIQELSFLWGRTAETKNADEQVLALVLTIRNFVNNHFISSGKKYIWVYLRNPAAYGLLNLP
jgi:hypothetical protein